MAYENYTVRQFMRAWFDADFSEMSREEFETCYTEYIDTAGLFATENFEKITYIQYLNNRINVVRIAVNTHKEFIEFFGCPLIKHLDIFKRFGYSIKYENKEQFIKELDSIVLRENRYISELEITQKQLDDLKNKSKKKPSTLKESRVSFIRMLNSLNKIGWKIDNDKTMVEELSIIVKQQSETD